MDISTAKTWTQAVLASKKFQVTMGLAATAAGSSALTFVVLNKRLEAKYEKLANEEIAAAKDFYSRLDGMDEDNQKSNPVEEDQDDESEVESMMQSYFEGDSKSEEEVEEVEEEVEEDKPRILIPDKGPIPKPQKKNVFEKNNQEWDWEIEEAIREECLRDDLAYIITYDEFMESDVDREQGTLTYFEGDDVLADDQDVVVEDEYSVVGPVALTRFGHGSKDNNVVYVRNPKMDMDFEIIRSTGKYAREVLGFNDEPELRHSNSPRKFRRYYE